MSSLPQIEFGGQRISRLILGGNPISGNSHTSVALDKEMMDYFTAENTKTLFRECERCGINTTQLRGDSHIMRLLREYANEGGKLHWIAQTASEMADLRANVRRIAAAGPIAIYHHGTETDNLWHTGQHDVLRERLAIIRDAGLWVGLGTHTPEVIEQAEEEGWDVDFYMASAYNVYHGPRQSLMITGKRGEESYDDRDRERMCDLARAVSKPCLLFKILAAGRKPGQESGLKEAFTYIFEHIKPQDAVVVGMFPKHANQVEENARLLREVLADA